MKMILAAGMLALAAGAANAQVWNEIPDAGELAAQNTVGVGVLSDISGVLGNNPTGAVDFVDMYCIYIPNPATFSATLVGGAAYDTQLFLFDMAGNGVTFNDDSASTTQSTISGAFIPGPGHYMIAVTAYDNDALNAGGLQMWADTPFGTERPMDGAGGILTSWDHFSNGNEGAYRLHFSGAEFCDVPAPASLALLGLGGLVAGRRRR